MGAPSVEQAIPTTRPAGPPPASPMVDPRGREPIRAEMLGLDGLEAHARQLAAASAAAAPRRVGSPLLRRFSENGKALVAAHARIVGGADANREGRGFDAEWLADNFHIVEDTLREVKRDLPHGYDEELPKLVAAPLAGYPRVYGLALSLVAHSDSELDEPRIDRFVSAFQEVAPLTIGELWALPTMLRLVVVENLRRLAEQMLWGWDERLRAEAWAAETFHIAAVPGAAGRPDTVPVAPEIDRRSTPAPLGPTDPFLVRLMQLLRDQGPGATAELERLEEAFEGDGADSDDILRREHRRQAASQVSVGNCVISLRLLSALDWNAFFERTSRVEAILRGDPSGVYPTQDFPTRDRYRRAVEKFARGSATGSDEQSVARGAVALARAYEGPSHARKHVGFYLVDAGHRDLTRACGYRASGGERAVTWVIAHPLPVYFGSIAAIMALILAPLSGVGAAAGVGLGGLALILAAALLPASELAVGMVNNLLTVFMPPRVLPKLEMKKGLPAGCDTFIVMPSMLIRPNSSASLLERLEIHHLANPDPRFRFALLTDFADAPAEVMPEDAGYVRSALEGVRALNEKYAPGGPDKFFLFHRRREYNPVQGCWMGWERKRGKLSEFNRLIRGDATTSYAVRSGDPDLLPRMRFVITLDSDTQMTRDTARRMVGTLAHPLVAPRFDPAAARVVEGHGVLQPRVGFHLTAATKSRFAAILASSGGIDPYSTAASDAYMDLFGVGSFTGKGIYDVDAFEAATGHTFPENQILSHDLIEGNYARCGLLSDTELFDDFPARYHAFARREHRWVRGDWQLLPWLGRTVPTDHGPVRNPLPPLERWKLADNLRRSLVPPALVVLLVLGWTVLPGSPWIWTALALAVPGLALVQVVLATIVEAMRGRSLAVFNRLRDSLPATGGQALLSIAFLADQARLLVDATARTLTRLLLTRRNMLEWETAASTEQRMGAGPGYFFRVMWPAPALALAVTALVARAHPSALAAAAPVLALWLVSPLVAYWVSQPRALVVAEPTAAQRRELRRVARKTWHFFETFVGDEDHWLPPDNYQEEPDGRVAHRTSPTNQGLLVLSTLAAHDFGFVGTRALVERLEKTFDALDAMEKHWGHFYNWYDTRTLAALPPGYISTVDSGNMLACLVTLNQGLHEVCLAPLLDGRVAAGMADTLALAAEALHEAKAPAGARALGAYRALEEDFQQVDRRLAEPPAALEGWDEYLGALEWASVGLIGRIRALAEAGGSDHPVPERLEPWVRRFAALVKERRTELAALAPWPAAIPACDESTRGPAWASTDLTRRWLVARGALTATPSLAEAGSRLEPVAAELDALADAAPADAAAFRALAGAVRSSIAADLAVRLRRVGDRADALGKAMDFRPLYKTDRHLFAIGCNLAQGKLDGACYDLVASEACLTSMLTIARGDAPRRHWFQLGRPYIKAAGRLGLLSWGGTMFEYLMPRLMMRSLAGTVVAEACKTAVAGQVEYGRQQGVPWGISESAYNAQYADGDYQYQAFGVPGLGLKRGLEKDLVVAPYATLMATMIDPRAAAENLRRLAGEGGEGPYGYYEAIDFTRDRVPKGKKSVVVRQYMAHHQGMGLVALANALLGEPMPRRFHAEPMIKAVELLLQERVPRDAPIIEPSGAGMPRGPSDPLSGGVGGSALPLMSRRLTTAATPAPRTLLLSNTNYHVMLTNAGSGYASCRGLDVTRWREDATLDNTGQFFYIRDVDSGATWSAAHQPIGRAADGYEAVFAADKASFRRRDGVFETLMEVTVSPEHLAEVRRITLANHDAKAREVEVTSYAEITLMSRGGDAAHPAFGKLFLETEHVAGTDAVLCRRRPRSSDQEPIWAVHVVAVDPAAAGGGAPVQVETDRARFLGRGRSTADPAALDPGAELSGTTGPVLDPVVSLRRRLRIEPGGSAVVAFTTAVADSREEALALADQYRSLGAAGRAFEMAWATSQVEHRHRGWSPEEAHQFQRLASHLIYAGSALRANPTTLAANAQGQPGLWKFGISGDKPIALVRLAGGDDLPLARQALTAHGFLRLKGLEFDLVLLSEEAANYNDGLYRQLQDAVRSAGSIDLMDKPGGVFVRKGDGMPEADRVLLQAAARVVLVGDRGPLAGQLDRIERISPLPAALAATREPTSWPEPEAAGPAGLQFANGLGGFSADGREYVIAVHTPGNRDVRRNGTPRPGPRPRPALPPAPWVNVVANPNAGFLASEAGLGMTWAGNSQANRLTTWSNDPVVDPPSEAVYVRDESTGEFWSPTPLPVPDATDVRVVHGQGYTTYARATHGLSHELTAFVPGDDPVKLLVLKVRNAGPAPRKLSATYYAEWVLGETRDKAPMQVVTQVDPETHALLARNTFATDFAGRVAFADVDARSRSMTADRGEFLGRNGSASDPASLRRVDLSGRVGAAIDPCAAIRAPFELAAGEERTLIFAVGQGEDLDAARTLILRYREPGAAAAALDAVKARWESILGAVQVRTPDPAMDLLLNRWLPYQVLSCRMWGRSGFYQSSGAYGFRDQLQDSMAMAYGAPGEARAQLLRAAARQFTEGDVQHWWHPPTGRGVRTKITDDLIWLPFVACHYATVTGDTAVLDERVPFLKAATLRPDQEEDYGQPAVADQDGTLYEHCARALDRAHRLGAHGLPLMGTGDWNDGMNRVGAGGKGESVWNAWFLMSTLNDFAPTAEARGDSERAALCRSRAEALRAAVEATSWDGDWYLRAFFDDGTPLGSSRNDECRIDSIAQTWAVLSGVADPGRARRAFDSVDAHLVRRDDRTILLFEPPFDCGHLHPGYIKGYVPGIRENGGQYTHAATWVPMAAARLGLGRRAVELFDILNPILHAADPAGVALYKVEPYVLAGDVYGMPPHSGRGGWSWYTGSAAWLFRVGLESILGLHLRGGRLGFAPCIPEDWPGFEVVYRHRGTTYRIAVENPHGNPRVVVALTLDGQPSAGDSIPLVDDGREHEVRVILGAVASA